MFGAEEATSFGHSAVSSVTNKKLMEKAFRENKYLQEYAFQQNREMWDASNEYNLPINQMQRLRDAGINPHLAYSKGTINNVGSNQLPKYQAATANYYPTKFGGSYGSSMGDYFDLKRKKADADIGGSVARQESAKAQITEATVQTQIDKYIADLEKKKADTDNVHAKKLYTDQLNKWAVEKTRYAKKLANMADQNIFVGDHIITRLGAALLKSMSKGERGPNIMDDWAEKHKIINE